MTETDELHDSTQAARRETRIAELAEAMTRAVERETYSKKIREFDVNTYERYQSKLLPALELPGFGERLDDCGKDLPHFCRECGATATFGRTCRRSVCPRCASTWVRDQSVQKFKRLLSLLKLEISRNGRAYPHHLSISPPQNWAADAENQREALEAGFDAVKGIMDALDVQGIVAYHPYRGRDEHREGADDRGEWKHRLFSERDWHGDVRDELRPSGHFHVVCISPFVPGGEATKRLYEETGWIVDRIADDETGRSIGRSGDIDRDMAAVVAYILSHTGIYEDSAGNNRAACRYVGADIDGILVDEETEQKAKRLTKEVAWKTLGIPSANTLCGQSLARTDGQECDAEACDHDHDHGGNGGDGRDGQPEQEATATTAPDATSAGTVERNECDGELVSLGGAPSQLEDEEWVRDAPHVDETVAALFEYAKKEQWIMDALRRSEVTQNDHHLVERLRELRDGG